MLFELRCRKIINCTARFLNLCFFFDRFQNSSSGEYESANVSGLERDIWIVGDVNFDSCIKGLSGLSGS